MKFLLLDVPKTAPSVLHPPSSAFIIFMICGESLLHVDHCWHISRLIGMLTMFGIRCERYSYHPSADEKGEGEIEKR